MLSSFCVGTTANVGIRLYDERGCSIERFLWREGAFRRNSHDIFLVATDEKLVYLINKATRVLVLNESIF